MAGYAARVAVERSGSCRDTMVTPLPRATGKISIDPAGARCDRNLAPRERPRHRRRLRSVTTTDQASGTNRKGRGMKEELRSLFGSPENCNENGDQFVAFLSKS